MHICQKIAALLKQKPTTLPQWEAYQNYLGTYAYQGQRLQIIIKEERLVLEQDGVSSSIIPLDDHSFITEAGIFYDWLPNENTTAMPVLTMHLGNQVNNWEKIASEKK